MRTGAKASGAKQRAVFVGDELLVAQCAVKFRGLTGGEAVVVSADHGVLQHAADEGLPGVERRSAADVESALDDHDASLLFSIGLREVLPTSALNRVGLAVNFHDGLLPEYGGLNVTTWSIANGATEHGITWHVMTALADRGDVLLEERFDVQPHETAFSLNARCYEAGLSTFDSVVMQILSGTGRAQPQNAGERTMYSRVRRPIAAIDPSIAAAILERLVRALDVGSRRPNSVGRLRWVLGNADWVVVTAAHVEPVRPDESVGNIEFTDTGVRIATVADVLVITAVEEPDGRRVAIGEIGDRLSAPDVDHLTIAHGLTPERDASLAAHESWWIDHLDVGTPSPSVLGDWATGIDTDSDLDDVRASVAVSDEAVETGALLACVALWLSTMNGESTVRFGCVGSSPGASAGSTSFEHVPVVTYQVDQLRSLRELIDGVATAATEALDHGPFLTDLVGRVPALRGQWVEPELTVHFDGRIGESPPFSLIALMHDADGSVRMSHRLQPHHGARVAAQLTSILATVAANPTATADSVQVASPEEVRQLEAWNDTTVKRDLTLTIDALFRAQVVRTPDSAAISCGSETLSYRELDDEVGRMAQLLRNHEVGRGTSVGIAVDRSIDMVVSVLAVLSCGAHYVPLDPTYPADRLRHMVDDSGTLVIVSTRAIPEIVGDAHVVVVDPGRRAALDPTGPLPPHEAHDVAYVIYTSGSTGIPKGVQLEHEQVVNFFVAMGEVVDDHEAGVWLAVTSLSFDISVLELLFTLTVGFHVVVKQDSGFRSAAHPAVRRRRAPSMSLFYFAADAAQASDGYRLLLDGARWADSEGFEAVWTPERHFHDFGAPYPNPSVVSAALAVATDRIAIRAGSVVLPLHSPVRVAEEWAIVDNLSGGRVGISFASGWQPNDFVLRPDAYATAREGLPELIDTVRRLWRGEHVELEGPDGKPVAVATQPRPVQAELPTWITSAGNPDSFARAGRLGHNVLTHLIGQTIDQLSDNVALYHEAWREAGHDGAGRITLMLHSFLHDDGDRARSIAREPLKGYLGTAVGLLKDLASAFPTFGGAGADADDAFRLLDTDQISQLLDHATDRYLRSAGLFGTIDDAIAVVDAVSDAGADEIACLIDFGIEGDEVRRGLVQLGALRQRLLDRERSAAAVVENASPDQRDTVADLTRRHGVTHLQCTPSLASMLVVDPADRKALGSLRHMMVGGEALAPSLAATLRKTLPGRLTNMYGPTETAIWSLVHEIDDRTVGQFNPSVPIGRPVANTTVHVLDEHRRQVPLGVLGQLHLGGQGVARGYLNRPELTAGLFLDLPGAGRVYATGDLVKLREDGIVEFAGRVDNQVKIRGHRIELGEIESVLDAHPEVVQSVVVARGEDPARLVAFVVRRGDALVTASDLEKQLRDTVRMTLPEAMIPSAFAMLPEFPMTPNGKVDRAGLPKILTDSPPVRSGGAPPSSGAEEMVWEAWTTHLHTSVGRDENFFDVGGHSLLAVAIFRKLVDEVGPALSLTDLFRFPTIRTLAEHIERLSDPASGNRAADPKTSAGGTRGEKRRRARSRVRNTT